MVRPQTILADSLVIKAATITVKEQISCQTAVSYSKQPTIGRDSKDRRKEV